MSLYHEGLSCRDIASRLRKDYPKNKNLHVSHDTVSREIRNVIAYYREQACDFYADRLARELALADEMHFQARKAFDESRKRSRKSKARGEISSDQTTLAPDPRFSSEIREWSNHRLKLLGFLREQTVASQETVQHGPDIDLAPYQQSLQQLGISVVGQERQNVSPTSAVQSPHTPQADNSPGFIPPP